MYAALGVAAPTIVHDMFHLSIPVLEKVVRPWIVYLCLVLFLRIFGKRELAQLNPFDLVVLLSLSNTVQNAIIGDDNSVTGGLVGAFSLLTINWVLNRVMYSAPKLNATLQGTPAILVRDGVPDKVAMKRERLSGEELISILNKNGFATAREVEICVLEPNGSFYVKGKSPSPTDLQRTELLEALRQLTAEVHALR